MDKIIFLNLFEEKIRGRIIEFCNEINKSKAKLYISMARKAACFINALEELSMIAINGEVISDRVLDTEIDWSGIDKIIIIDDVIISGTTLNRTIKKIKAKNPEIEIKVFVLGVNEKWFNEELLQDDAGNSYLELPIKPLENSQCIKLSGDIVKVLAMMPTPYNIDYPIYNLFSPDSFKIFRTLKINCEDYDTMLNMPNWEMSDVCSYEQMQNNIFIKTFRPTNDCLISCGNLFFNDLIKDSLLKIRIYGKKGGKKKETFRFSIVPMAVLPPLKKDLITDLFNHLAAEKGESLSKILNSVTAKLRFIQFVIADRLANVFIQEFDYFTGQNTVIRRQDKSLRFLFPTCIINDILGIADKSILNIDLEYKKNEIKLKEIQSPYPIDNFIGINDTLNLPFLNMYYDDELQARKLAKQYGKKVFNIPDYQNCMNRLNKGYSLLDLKNLLRIYSPNIQTSIISTYLDKAIDSGIAVPITATEKNGTIVYRAYRHGEDVQFGQREERLCYEMFDAFNNKVKKTEWQQLWLEKLMVFFLKIGETRKFLNPIQTDIESYRHIDVASVKYYFQGPVVKKVAVEKYDKNPCLEYADKAYWLSKDLLQSSFSPLIRMPSKMYSFDKQVFDNNNNGDKEIIIDKSLKTNAREIGSIFGMLIRNSFDKRKPYLSTDDLIALSCCCEPKDVIGALAAEINLSNKNHKSRKSNVQILIDIKENRIGLENGIKKIRNSSTYKGLNDGQRKFKWYIQKYPHQIIKNKSLEFDDDVYKGIWDSFWSPNLDWTEESEEKGKLDLAKKEGLWLLCANIYFLIAEYCLRYQKQTSTTKEKLFKTIENYYDNILPFSSDEKVQKIIPFVRDFINNRNNNDYIKPLFDTTILKINSLFSQADKIVSEAKEFYNNYQRIPEMKHYTTALYVDCEDERNNQIISNSFMAMFGRIKNSATHNKAILRCLPNNEINQKLGLKGRWYIGNGGDAPFWILQLAKGIISGLNGKDNYKIFYFSDLLPNNNAIKIVDNQSYTYNKFWDFVEYFAEIINNFQFQNNIIFEITDSYMTDTIKNKNDDFANFLFSNSIEIDVRLPDVRKFKLTEYKDTQNMNKEKFNIGIITIVTEEVRAVKSEFGLTNHTIKEERYFDIGNHRLPNGKDLKIVHLQTANQGNTSVVSAYQSMIRNYTLDYVVLLGIAGSIKNEIKLCDVIIGTNVIYYEKKKETGGGLHRRGEFYNMKFKMIQFINRFFVNNNEPASFESSENSLKQIFNTHRCLIGSGETVIANNLSNTKEWLLEVNSKTGVVETESAGLCQAFSETENISNEMDIILIRGISDHADCGKDDKWRFPASKNAVIVLKKLLEVIYEF